MGYTCFMKINKTNLSIILLLIMFFIFFVLNIIFNNENTKTISKIVSPIEFIMDDKENIKLNDIDIFDSDYTIHNKELAEIIGISEDEAFIIGNLGKYWAKNILEGRKIKLYDNDVMYYKFRYKPRLKNSPFAFINSKPTNEQAFMRKISSIKRGKYVILDLDSDVAYPISKSNRDKVTNFIIVRKSHINNKLEKPKKQKIQELPYKSIYNTENIKIILSDMTTKTIPDRNCSSDICKEILTNIENAKDKIDIAIYGYSSIPKIENAIKSADSRGVKIRLVYDVDANGNNIYPDTNDFLKLISNNSSDINSPEVKNTMHNKFYIFDNKTVITGSANLSHTDMSGFNSNSIIVINSPKIAEFYTQEFEQLYNGKFHNDKSSTPDKTHESISVFFSPQDKAVKNGILPLIRNAKNYIYIPAFVITEKRITEELLNAKKRGVDIKIIADALNTSTKHSKHKELRAAGIPVKAENYAGKMHAKTMIIDDEYLVIGSMNFSNSGENRNDENTIILKNTGAAKFYKNFFLYQWDKIPDKWLKYTPRAESIDSIGSCSDGIDNNYDGKIDLNDDGCRGKYIGK